MSLIDALLTLINNVGLAPYAVAARTLFDGILVTQYGYTMDISKMEYMLIGEYGDVYYVSTNTASVSGNVSCVY